MSAIAAEMITQSARINEASEFEEWLSENDAALSNPGMVGASIREPIYGPVIATNMNHLRSNNVEPQLALAAIGILQHAAIHSANNYYTRVFEESAQVEKHVFLQALGRTQAMMADGTINKGAWMPPEFGMLPTEGLAQVNTAQKLLSGQAQIVGRLLSDANYENYFTFRTMADGKTLLDTTISDLVERKDEEQMPHVIRTNYAMGQLVAGLVEASRGRVTLIDNGAGTGGTSAAIVSALNELADRKGIDVYDRLSLHAVESSFGFYRLYADLAQLILPTIEYRNSKFKLDAPEDKNITDDENVYHMIHDDITAVIDGLETLPAAKKDMTIVAANYIWHRLPDMAKARMIQKIGKLSPNSIFLVADLTQNASAVNRHYFNFGNNGILNCGNVDLQNLFEGADYKVKLVGQDINPSSVHPTLLRRLSDENRNDGFFWVAYKGDEAERAVRVA
jgi:hypothetical protein